MPNPRTFYKHRTQSSKLFAPTSNIRFDSPLVALSRPFGLNTGFGSPYFALSGSIRALDALSRPFGLNTGFGRPISPFRAQYGLLGALFRPFGLNTGFGRPIACGNTGFWAAIGARPIRRPILPGVALRSPRAVFWRPFRALAWVALRLPQPRGCTSFTLTPGLHFVYPGLYSGAPSGRSCGL